MGYNYILMTCLFLILAIILSYVLVYPLPKKMVINSFKKKSSHINLHTHTNFLVFITIGILIVAITLYARYETEVISNMEWYALFATIPVVVFIFWMTYIYQQKIFKKTTYLMRTTTEMLYQRKKVKTGSIVYIGLVVTIVALIVFHLYASLLKSNPILIEDAVNIGVIGLVIFIFLFFFFGLLDVFTELSNLEAVKIERVLETIEGMIVLETDDSLFIKQLSDGEIIVVNKQLTEIISYKKS